MKTRRDFLNGSASTGIAAYLGTASPQALFAQERLVAATQVAVGKNGAATVHPIATEAAASMLRQGGNAIDAAVAAAFCLGVVDGHNSGIGGGCLILVRDSSGGLHAIDGREKAPAASSPSLYLREGKPSVSLSQTGPLASGVPGQVAALHQLHSKLGKLPWSKTVLPAIKVASDGFVVGKATHNAIAGELKELQQFESSRSVLCRPDGSPRAIGELLQQSDLAKTLTSIAESGSDFFYQGEFARKCEEYLKSLGGVMTAEDFGNYEAKERRPVDTRYRGYRVLGFPTPSSGGIHIAQMLNILQNFELARLFRESPVRFYHVVAESMKLAFADRAHWLGDSDFVQVPEYLTDPQYANSLAKRIRMDQAIDVAGHGEWSSGARGHSDDSKKHTTHLTTADASGNWVAITNTVNTSWGSKVMVPGTGVMLNNEMDDFSIAPGIPNAFGLVGAEANAVAPNKRPLSSMSPTIVLDSNDQPFLTCGAAGGPKIINATLQNIVRCIDLSQNIAEAIASGRIHHQWRPNVLSYEMGRSIEPAIAEELSKLGHIVKGANSLAIAQGIQRTNNGFIAASDPRTASSAVAID
jgi:gamma-glutamyltranspeptidase / glutathione hydrolase